MAIQPQHDHLQVASVFIVNDDFTKVLLPQRKRDNSWAGGKWETPGGKVDPGENISEAVVREVREELGVDLVLGDAIATLYNRKPDKQASGAAAKKYAMFDITHFVGRIAEGQEPRALESEQLQWWDIDFLGYSLAVNPSHFVASMPLFYPLLMAYREQHRNG